MYKLASEYVKNFLGGGTFQNKKKYYPKLSVTDRLLGDCDFQFFNIFASDNLITKTRQLARERMCSPVTKEGFS